MSRPRSGWRTWYMTRRGCLRMASTTASGPASGSRSSGRAPSGSPGTGGGVRPGCAGMGSGWGFMSFIVFAFGTGATLVNFVSQSKRHQRLEFRSIGRRQTAGNALRSRGRGLWPPSLAAECWGWVGAGDQRRVFDLGRKRPAQAGVRNLHRASDKARPTISMWRMSLLPRPASEAQCRWFSPGNGKWPALARAS